MLDIKKLIRNYLLSFTKREVLYTPHSSYRGSEGYYNTPTLVTLLPNTRYLLVCDGYSNNGGVIQYYSTFGTRTNADTVKQFINPSQQPTNGSGGHFTVIGYAETGNSNVEVGLNSYIYVGGYTYYWNMYAIPLVYLGGVLRNPVISRLSAFKCIPGRGCVVC